MDLLKLAAKIELDDSSYNKGIMNAEKAGQQLAGKMGAMTVAVGNLAADMIKKAASAVGQVISGATQGYADYQQLIGGVETLFKQSSDRVANYAKESYKTAGISANEYMETVTSFSASLLQGLGGNTEAAADLANMAITDMSDNANKMGTSMSSIQAAYQGFAKQNYTMLDNLKLGYGGTREEMIRLINDSGILNEEISSLDGITFDQIVQAIHEIQTQMGITGTTAKEAAETISGSKNSLKAAWEDLLSAVGGEGDQARLDQTLENFKSSFATYMQNFIPSLVTSIGNSGALVEAIADSIAGLPTTLLAEVGERGLQTGTQIVNGASKIVTWLIDSITTMFTTASADTTQIEKFGEAIGEFIGNAIQQIAVNAPALVTGIFNVGVALAGSLVKGLFAGLFGLEGDEVTQAINQIDEELNESISDTVSNYTKAQGILDYMQSLADKYGEAAKETDEYRNALGRLNEVMEVPDWILDTNAGLTETISLLREYSAEMKKAALEQAKQKALQEKMDLWTTAQGNLLQTQSDIQIKRSELAEARQAIIDWFQGAVSSTTGEPINFSLDQDSSAEQIKFAAETALNDVTGGPGNEAYDKAKPILDGWLNTITENEGKIKELEGKLPDLESAATEAQIAYLTSAAAIDDLTGSASGAAAELAKIKAPQLGMNSGQFAAWFYSGGVNYSRYHATGMDYIPYDNYPAMLHRGEAVLTKSENEARRGGMSARELSSTMEDALITAMEQVAVYMSGNKVGNLTTKTVKSNINSENYSRQRAMGG